jgi:redox-sensitive bicupin YhaK (pirin superfamily)
MLAMRRAEDRGKTNWGWLDSRHTFSFGDYYDPRQMGFRSLRVINDDRVEPGGGFPTHGHRDMEILSYVLEGALEHKDSMGHGSVIRPGELQFMRAGTGVTHSEFNPSRTEPVHFLQIWIMPKIRGLDPHYDQRPLASEALRRGLVLAASQDGREGSIRLQQDADLYVTRLGARETRTHSLARGRQAYVHVATGELAVNGQRLREGDGVALAEEPQVQLEGTSGGEALVFDLG